MFESSSSNSRLCKLSSAMSLHWANCAMLQMSILVSAKCCVAESAVPIEQRNTCRGVSLGLGVHESSNSNSRLWKSHKYEGH